MRAIETTAVFEGPDHLHLAEPVAEPVSGEVRVIVLLGESVCSEKAAPDFRGAIGSYYRDYPGESVRDSNRWLKELREGEAGVNGLGR